MDAAGLPATALPSHVPPQEMQLRVSELPQHQGTSDISQAELTQFPTHLHLLPVSSSSEMRVPKVPPAPRASRQGPPPCITSAPPWNSSRKPKCLLPLTEGPSQCNTWLGQKHQTSTRGLEPQVPPQGTLSHRERGLLSACKRECITFSNSNPAGLGSKFLSVGWQLQEMFQEAKE